MPVHSESTKPCVEVPLGRPIVGEGIGVAPVVDEISEQSIERLRVAELVLSERAHRDVLFEDGCDARPLGVGEPDDELVVGHREQQHAQRLGRGRLE
jgi:hypothetical protein